MKHQFITGALILAMASGAVAQMATSHTRTTPAPAPQAAPLPVAPQGPARPVVRVNGTVLTSVDLLREMYALFPYAKLHNGFPKDQEPGIRQGAMGMIVFEELVYQDAKRQKMSIAPERISREVRKFRKEFKSQAEFNDFLKAEMDGSEATLRQKIERSLLIQAVLKSQVEDKSVVTLNDARLYYAQHPKEFEHGESFTLQTISIIPPPNANPETVKETGPQAQAIYEQAKATKSYKDFGLLAEKQSDDDYRVDMGVRKEVAAEKLPPEIVKALRGMKPGEVSGLIHLGTAYTILRLDSHTMPGKKKFEAVKAELIPRLEKEKYEKLRVALDSRLHKNAKIENL
jgi:foldase protein PrsA